MSEKQIFMQQIFFRYIVGITLVFVHFARRKGHMNDAEISSPQDILVGYRIHITFLSFIRQATDTSLCYCICLRNAVEEVTFCNSFVLIRAHASSSES